VHRIVIDTNVLVSALRSKRGASYELFSLIGDPRWQAAISAALVLEYEAIAKRQAGSRGVEDWVIDAIIDMICATSNHHGVHFRTRPALPDPNDEFILELAVNSQSDFIVTYNVKDFRGSELFGVRAVTPAEFLRIIGERT
jgi:putative PIN family toxin of toxin-antitoxin system